MKKRKRKKNKEQVVRYECPSIPQERMIEIQAEAYYRALKRIENEKNLEEAKKPEKKYKWYEDVFFVLNVLFWPWKINKRFSINNRLHDSILVLFVSGVLKYAGGIMWLSAIWKIVYGVWRAVKMRAIAEIIKDSPVIVFMLFIGSAFVLASETFKKETDSNKIYAYSGSIIALIGCVISIISLFGM